MVLGHYLSGNLLACLQLSCPAEILNKPLFFQLLNKAMLFFQPQTGEGDILPTSCSLRLV